MPTYSSDNVPMTLPSSLAMQVIREAPHYDNRKQLGVVGRLAAVEIAGRKQS